MPHDGLEGEWRPWKYCGVCFRSPYTSIAWTDSTVFARTIIYYCRSLCVISLKIDIILSHNNFVVSATMASYVGDESVQDSTTSASTSRNGSSVKGKQRKRLSSLFR